jgi:hypothetical protein
MTSNTISSENLVKCLALLSDNIEAWRDNLECTFFPDLSCLKYESFFMSPVATVVASEVYKLLPSATAGLKNSFTIS